MRKYPYSYEEFEKATKIQFLKDYCKNDINYMNSLIKSENLIDVIKGSYNSAKSEYESGDRELLKDIKQEVRSTVACLGMF